MLGSSGAQKLGVPAGWGSARPEGGPGPAWALSTPAFVPLGCLCAPVRAQPWLAAQAGSFRQRAAAPLRGSAQILEAAATAASGGCVRSFLQSTPRGMGTCGAVGGPHSNPTGRGVPGLGELRHPGAREPARTRHPPASALPAAQMLRPPRGGRMGLSGMSPCSLLLSISRWGCGELAASAHPPQTACGAGAVDPAGVGDALARAVVHGPGCGAELCHQRNHLGLEKAFSSVSPAAAWLHPCPLCAMRAAGPQKPLTWCPSAAACSGLPGLSLPVAGTGSVD